MLFRWEMTPFEVFNGAHVLHEAGTAKLSVQQDLLSAPVESLPGTAYRVQIDGNSGARVLNSDRVVASYSGMGGSQQLCVAPDFRGEGIALALLTLWYVRTQRPIYIGKQGVTPASARLLLKAHKAAVLDVGKDVPSRVVAAIAAGDQERAILRVVAKAVHA